MGKSPGGRTCRAAPADEGWKSLREIADGWRTGADIASVPGFRLPRWTPGLSGDGPVEPEAVDGPSTETAGRTPAKTGRNPGCGRCGACPRRRTPDLPMTWSARSRPVAGSLTGTPLRALPGKPAGCDHWHERNGTAGPFMPFAPLSGWRRVKVANRRTGRDFAHVPENLVDVRFQGGCIVPVMDNLNVRGPSTLHEPFDVEAGVPPPRPVRGGTHAPSQSLAGHG
ncbi:MAG: hypothetical protein OXD29_13910 [Roseovarius sp.]|nr:hypothetical protein [Roseovarius sp.]